MCHQFIERFQNSKYPASLTLYSRETCCEYNTSQFLHWWKKNLFGISSKKTMKKQTLRGFDWTWQYWWRGQRRYGSAPLSLCKSDLGWIFWPRCSICWFFFSIFWWKIILPCVNRHPKILYQNQYYSLFCLFNKQSCFLLLLRPVWPVELGIGIWNSDHLNWKSWSTLFSAPWQEKIVL